MAGIRIILMLAALGFVTGAGKGWALAEPSEEIFLLGATDIPLMPGLTEDEAATVFFDKPAGRIMIARPGGCIDPKEAKRYYGATLPQLGWLPVEGVASLSYLREGERLTLEFATDFVDDFAGGRDVAREPYCAALRFLLSPISGRAAGEQEGERQ